MSHEKVVAVYDTAAHAEAAVETLKSAGYSANDISITRNGNEAPTEGLNEPGFRHRLFGRDISLRETAANGQNVVRTRTVVTVRVPESEVPKVIEVLDPYQPVDVLDRARTHGSSAAPPKVAVPPPTSAAGVSKDGEVVYLAEEQLIVGKRQVDAGVTRVRRFSVEKPVEASVTLHDERVEVMRRAISDPGYLDIDSRDQTIDVTETTEQPVLNKTVRVTEEVVIRRKGSDHIETVHDTVRRQQLEVERVPAETTKG
jgi:stress response protein YsnF